MEFEEMFDRFCDTFPFAQVEDYRPVCHELFEEGKQGMTIWLKNGDMLVYYPKEGEQNDV